MLPAHVRKSFFAFDVKLKQRYTAPARQCASRCCYSSISPDNENQKRAKEVTDVAILGGGITGLVTAFYLSRLRPDTRITIFEGSSRLGGWLHTRSVDVGNGNVIFEQGPRNLRPSVPNGLVTLSLVR